jgi:ribosomal protein L35
MIKTNKSYTKRLKVTRNGKIVSRKAGQNHFNTRESRNKHTNRRRTALISMKNKDFSRFLATS